MILSWIVRMLTPSLRCFSLWEADARMGYPLQNAGKANRDGTGYSRACLISGTSAGEKSIVCSLCILL